jgi:carboxymethylenebutenolidase
MFSQDLDSLTPHRGFNRRAFVQTSLGCGFAAAALPVGAQTIKTDSQGLVAGEVSIPVGKNFKLPAYRAAPEGKTSDLPVVLVLSEIFGVHEHIADVARRFAKQGYLAIAPELFIRQGNAKASSDITTLLSTIISKVPDEQVLGDLDATVAWALTQGADPKKLGVTGFCWGGRMTWLYTAHNPKVKAAVAWYGRLVGEASNLNPRHPLDLAALLHAPVLGLYGGDDSGIPQDSIDKMKLALAAAPAVAKASEFVVYPDTPHAFHADYRPSYRKAAADDGWKRCLAWFKQHGVGI